MKFKYVIDKGGTLWMECPDKYWKFLHEKCNKADIAKLPEGHLMFFKENHAHYGVVQYGRATFGELLAMAAELVGAIG